MSVALSGATSRSLTGSVIGRKPVALHPSNGPTLDIVAGPRLEEGLLSEKQAIETATKLTLGAEQAGAAVTTSFTRPGEVRYDVYAAEITGATSVPTDTVPFHFEGTERLAGGTFPQFVHRNVAAFVDGATVFERPDAQA